jgi:glycogen debranching enzyme
MDDRHARDIMELRQITILEGLTFMVSDMRGNVEVNPAQPTGLFYRDMRHLSRWELRLNGRQLIALAGDAVDDDEAVVYLVEPTGTLDRNPRVSIVRRRRVGDGVRERLEVTNHHSAPIALQITMLFDADFADIFEIKDQLAKRGRLYREVGDGFTVLGYARGDFARETRISAGDGFYTQQSVDFRLELGPGQCWRREIEISVAASAGGTAPAQRRRPADTPTGPARRREWLSAVPDLTTDSGDLRELYRRSLADLAALRFQPDAMTAATLPAAGLPWFMALFGRDSLIVSYQALPFLPELAATTLRALAALQAVETDDFRDAEPGKILHELRHGELTHFGARPQSPYYGSADSTPLFLVLLEEYHRWTGDDATVRELEPAARAAMNWVEDHGDADRDGFIEYRTRNPDTGLVNQCWKDSWNSIVFPDGRLADLPRATCEIQGYAYDARRRTARLARLLWGDPAWADRLDADADHLRDRFEQAFWLPDKGFYALALDGHGVPVPTLTSNLGHLLWSGIVAEEHVDAVAGRLLHEDLFSGWGVRTMAAGQPAYNPIEYHNGTVWPHDNSLIAAGLARYGRRAEAARIARAVMDVGPHVGYRLPEALVGVARATTDIPVPYPSACSPQAWACGTTLLLLRVLLGLEPAADGVRVDPHLPDGLTRLALHGVHTPAGPRDAAVAGTA